MIVLIYQKTENIGQYHAVVNEEWILKSLTHGLIITGWAMPVAGHISSNIGYIVNA